MCITQVTQLRSFLLLTSAFPQVPIVHCNMEECCQRNTFPSDRSSGFWKYAFFAAQYYFWSVFEKGKLTFPVRCVLDNTNDQRYNLLLRALRLFAKFFPLEKKCVWIICRKLKKNFFLRIYLFHFKSRTIIIIQSHVIWVTCMIVITFNLDIKLPYLSVRLTTFSFDL